MIAIILVQVVKSYTCERSAILRGSVKQSGIFPAKWQGSTQSWSDPPRVAESHLARGLLSSDVCHVASHSEVYYDKLITELVLGR